MNWNWSYRPETFNSGKKWRFFVPRDLDIWWMTLKNNRSPLLYYIKFCTAFQSHWYIQTGVTVRKRPIRVKIGDFFCPPWPWKLTDDLEKQYGPSSILHQALCIISNPSAKWNLSYSPETLNSGQNWRFLSRVTLQFDGWPWKTIGHFSNAVSIFAHHFIATGDFKLELQSGNAQYGSKSTIFLAVWPWNLTDDLEKQ